MSPSTFEALLVTAVAVLPGGLYVWGFEREAGPFGVALSDRILRFVTASAILHLLLGWVEYAVWRAALAGRDVGVLQFGVAWLGALLVVALSAGTGALVGALYATYGQAGALGRVRRLLRLDPERFPAREERLLRLLLGRAPAPTAWDFVFTDRPQCLLRVWTSPDSYIVGRFSSASYAGGPNTRDLLLEDVFAVRDDGSLGDPLGYPVYLPETVVRQIDILEESPDGHQAEARHSLPGARRAPGDR